MYTKKIAYGLLITLALVICIFYVVLADELCPPTDIPPAPPTQTDAPTPTYEPTPTDAPPEATITPYAVGEPTPTDTDIPSVPETVTPQPTATETNRVGRVPGKTPTLPMTGGGLPPHVEIGLTVIYGIALVFMIFLLRRARKRWGI